MFVRVFYNGNQTFSNSGFGNLISIPIQNENGERPSLGGERRRRRSGVGTQANTGTSGTPNQATTSEAVAVAQPANQNRNRRLMALLKMKKLLKTVQVCSLLSAILVISQNLLILFLFHKAGWVVSLFLSLLIPYFGFEGARTRSIRLLSAYYIFAIASIIMFMIVSILQFESLKEVMKQEDLSRTSREMSTNYVIVNFVFGVVIALFQFVGLIASRSLIRYYLHGNLLHEQYPFRPGFELSTAQNPYPAERHAGLSDEFIKALPTVTVSPDWKEIENQPICPICQDDYQMDDLVKILPCHHCFHGKCIDQWLPRSENCPMCNQNLLALSQNQQGAISPIRSQTSVTSQTVVSTISDQGVNPPSPVRTDTTISASNETSSNGQDAQNRRQDQ